MRVGKNGDISVSASYGVTKSQVMAFIEDHRQWIEDAVARTAKAQAKRNSFYDQLPLVTAQQCKEAGDRLNALIPPLVSKYEVLMGVKTRGISYTRPTTRWGSCNTHTRHINFSAYLLLLPDWCVEHVVVHELAHLIVPNHSTAFYAVMDRFFPRWREARAHTRSIQSSHGVGEEWDE